MATLQQKLTDGRRNSLSWLKKAVAGLLHGLKPLSQNCLYCKQMFFQPSPLLRAKLIICPQDWCQGRRRRPLIQYP